MKIIMTVIALAAVMNGLTLPPASTGAAQSQANPQGCYNAAWEIIDQNFYYRDGLSDWDYWRHKYDGKLATQADADLAIIELLRYINDDYARYLVPGKNTASARSNFVGIQHREIKADSTTVGYIKVDTFASDHAVEGVREALKDMQSADGYIVDLRDNPGGYVDQATAMTALFMESGAICSETGRTNGARYIKLSKLTANGIESTFNGTTTVAQRETNLSGNKPLVLLVNGETKSAAEMFSGALQCNERCIVVGTQTFGKGVMQRQYTFDNGRVLSITIARWYLPDGVSINWRGIIPDLSVPQLSRTADLQLNAAVRKVRNHKNQQNV